MTLTYRIEACPACGAGQPVQVASRAELLAELEELWLFHTRRLRPGVPPARLQDRVAFSQPPPLQLVSCAGCGLLFRNPREDAAALTELYRAEAPAADTLRALLDTQRRSYRAQARRLARIAGGGRTGIEVGSYVGGFIAAAREVGWQFRGVDVNPHAVAFARAGGCEVTAGELEDVDAAGLDAVAFWNCFDQLADPLAAARAARRRLRPGGVLAVRVPDGAFYRRWRRRLRGPAPGLARAVLASNNLLGFPYRHGFGATSLRRLLSSAGFEVVRVFGDTLVPTADEWTRPWARAEERALKLALRAARQAPWLEVYARAA